MRYSFWGIITVLLALPLSPMIHADDASDYNELAAKFDQQYEAGNFREAEVTGKRALKLALTSLQDQPFVIKVALLKLANACTQQGHFDEAEQLFEYALKYVGEVFGQESEEYASCLLTYGVMRQSQSRYDDEVKLVSRGTAMFYRLHGPNHIQVGVGKMLLATAFSETGRYIEAETLFKEALDVLAREKGPESHLVAEIYTNRANLCAHQHRYKEAEDDCKRAITIIEKIYGRQHSSLAGINSNLGIAYRQQSRFTDAEKTYKRALMIAEKNLGENHPTVANIACCLSNMYIAQQRYEEAQVQIDRSLAIYEAVFGPNHSSSAESLFNLASLYDEKKDYEKAMSVVDRTLLLKQQAAMPPTSYFGEYYLRSQLKWKMGQKDAALVDLEETLSIGERSRSQVSGGEGERAETFSIFNRMFETMVQWQLELGNTERAFQTIERSRARSLLEEMNRAHVNLEAGRSKDERDWAKKREKELRDQISKLEQLFEASSANGNKDQEKSAKLRQALETARGELYDHYRDQLQTNPVYRDMLTRGTKQVTFDDVRKKLLKAGDLALIYLFGTDSGYVVALTLDQAKLLPLAIDENAAATFGVSSGPLTAVRLKQMLVGDQNEGVVPQLSKRPEKNDGVADPKLISKLEALYQLLIPDSERESLTNGKFNRLIIVPDSSLALFPMETLVVRGGQNPEYLLDAGPAILYGPSASVLCNLSDRSVTAPGKRPPVLTVADPIYPQEKANQPFSQMGEMSSGSRFTRLGGQLTRLPFTGVEARALIDAFRKAGTEMGQLTRELATEASVRFNAPDRKIIHLACHGLADQAYANFYGSLALTPGVQGPSNPADDGFLTLPEIYELNLNGCELAILSACQTNYGPQQEGEGTFALSRGFLVAGARRVVASNWLVDDEAAANLIGVFSAELAPSQKQRDAVDYATQLQVAKKTIREQERWKHPYFWSSLVLIGPP